MIPRWLYFSVLAAFLSLASCQPIRPSSIETASTANIPAPMSAYPDTENSSAIPIAEIQSSAEAVDKSPRLANPSGNPPLAARFSQKTISGISLQGVSFDSRSYHLAVRDQPAGPSSRWISSAAVTQDTGALAALNASFFTPEGEPLGLVVSQGKTSGSWNGSSSLGSGIFYENSKGTLSIKRRGTRSSIAGARHLIQAGPLLVENGRAIGGLNSGKVAARSFVVNDGGTNWWFGLSSPCTLSALGAALARDSPNQFSVKSALNLDGGRSTDFYVSGKIPGGPSNSHGFLNRPVRNFLTLHKR